MQPDRNDGAGHLIVDDELPDHFPWTGFSDLAFVSPMPSEFGHRDSTTRIAIAVALSGAR